ncbi:hypothetical protein [Luteolibacter soli]|uniref:Uncharacterized protein n=1 Tax=Luteolibacter soli TaxID=3135280 RepID=A0ABU9B534_9BACT
MNPYQPPQCSEPAAVAGEVPVMQVRYGLQYSLLFVFSGLVSVALAVVMDGLAKSTTVFMKPVTLLLVVAGVAHFALAVICRKKVYLEVFEDRLEFLSPVFPRWRRAKPLTSMGKLAILLHRLVARREDINRFVAWREGLIR